MVFKIDNPFDSERKISQSVIQVIAHLSMYDAELARILGLQCSDIGELTSGKRCIKQGSDAWRQAVCFIEMYHLLYDCFDGDNVAMYHWMRADNRHLRGTPHFLIVDDGQLQIIRDYLSQAVINKTNA